MPTLTDNQAPLTVQPQQVTRAEMRSLLIDFTENAEVRKLVKLMTTVHNHGQEDGSWDTTEGHAFEQAIGHLRLALDAASGDRYFLATESDR